TLAAFHLFHGGFCPENHAAPSGFKSFLYSLISVNRSTSGKIRCRNVLHEFLDGDVIIFDVRHDTVDHFREVVGRHVGGHTYSNTGSPVYQKAGDTGGKYG